MLHPWSTHVKKFWIHEDIMKRWYEARKIHDGTRPMEFITLKVNHIWKVLDKHECL